MKPLRSAVVVALVLGTAAFAADPVKVKVATDTSAASTRVVLTFAKKVACAVAEDAGRVKVTCDAAIAADPGSGTVDDAILKSFGPEGDRTLVFTAGRGYLRVDTFELKNPTRLVLDFSGTRAGKGAAAAAAPAPAKPLPVIAIDPGHGGVEVGATGPTGLQEKDLTLDLSRRLKTLLERQGVTVVLTSTDSRPNDAQGDGRSHPRPTLSDLRN